MDDEYVEGIVCTDSELAENEVRLCDLAEEKVLIVKQHGRISALGTKCTHSGAPLVNCALGNGKIRCQWHGACFNLLTGDIENLPVLDALPCHEVNVVNNEVRVRANRRLLHLGRRTKPMALRNADNLQHFVLIGGGAASASCLKALREEGFTGQITLICKERYLPYDRVKVSKAMDFDIEKALFFPADYYEKHNIQVFLSTEATSLDTTTRSVSLSNGDSVSYDKLFIATGMSAIKADIPGADLGNVVLLRDYDHAQVVNSFLNPDREILILGSGFLALEVANYCVNKVKQVTVICRDAIPFGSFLGEAIGGAFLKLFRDKGVTCFMNSDVVRCMGDSTVQKVELLNGPIIQADLVVMVVGSVYNTDFLRGSGVIIRKNGGIDVDDLLETNVKGVFAGGDISFAPVWSHRGQRINVGHFLMAHYHGMYAALNMLGKERRMEAVPQFWNMLFGKGVRFAGIGHFDSIVYVGDVTQLKFVAFYIKNDEVVAASSIGKDPVVSQFAQALSQNIKLTRYDVEGNEEFTWTAKLYQN